MVLTVSSASALAMERRKCVDLRASSFKFQGILRYLPANRHDFFRCGNEGSGPAAAECKPLPSKPPSQNDDMVDDDLAKLIAEAFAARPKFYAEPVFNVR